VKDRGRSRAVADRAIAAAAWATVRIRSDGSPNPAQRHTAGAPQPFALGFAGSRLEVSNAGSVGTPPDTSDPAQLSGSVLAFSLAGAGSLTATGKPREKGDP
jgi:hypothetical protein